MSEKESPALAHTPGPWHVESEPFNVWDAEGMLVAHVSCPFEDDEKWDEGCSNARLIAAAPDLLSACLAWQALQAHHPCRFCGADLRGNVWYCDERDRLQARAEQLTRDAVKKAKGGAK